MSGDSAMIRNKALIINNLLVLSKQRCMITAALGGKDTMLTAIVHVNKKTGQVIIDTSPSKVFNEKILMTKNVGFAAIFNGVQVAFSGSKIEKTKHAGYDSFIMPLPDSLYWFDRRNAYRIKTPIVNRAVCKIRLVAPGEESSSEYKMNYDLALKKIKVRMLERKEEHLANEQKAFEKLLIRMTPEEQEKAKLEHEEQRAEAHKMEIENPSTDGLDVIEISMFDLSMTGFAAINIDSEFSYFFQEGLNYEDCVIVMPEHGEVTISSVQVMMQRLFETDEIKQDDDIEEFIGLKITAATETTESIIFRYIQLLDRIMKKK